MPDAYKVLGTRSKGKITDAQLERVGVTWVPHVGPSIDTFAYWNNHKHDEEWVPVFRRMYTCDIRGNVWAQKELRKLTGIMDNGQDVVLGCFCGNALTCHRAILASWMRQKGYISEEI
jgi:uncharacterized protein YeaO (DUF488 family)